MPRPAAGPPLPVSIYFAGAGLGIAVSGTVIPPLLSHHPGRWPLAWAGLAAAAGLAAVFSWTAAADDAKAGSGADRTGADRANGNGVAAPLADWRPVAAMWRVSVAYLLFAAGYIAYITFLSAYLTAHHASVTQVAVTWAALGVAAIAEPVLWSRPLRAWPGARALAAALAALSAAAAVAIISADPAVVIVSAIGYGVSFLVVPAAITGLVHAAVPRPELDRRAGGLHRRVRGRPDGRPVPGRAAGRQLRRRRHAGLDRRPVRRGFRGEPDGAVGREAMTGGQAAGRMLALRWNTLSGSYSALIPASPVVIGRAVTVADPVLRGSRWPASSLISPRWLSPLEAISRACSVAARHAETM